MNDQKTFGNLIAMMVDNEAKGLKKLHLKSEKQAIKAIGKSAIFPQLHGLKKELSGPLYGSRVRPFFVQATQESLNAMGRPKTIEETPRY